ncbi:MAG: nitrous oxide reductase accessory protein NosL [Candidatus Saccharibacteria bacterium]|nr:nitrous oxide reductase accessory protein NosL [Pseudorhodobacter sp.]
MKRLLIALLMLTACKEDASVPLPVAMTADSTGYFCQMDILGHPGPKAQIHLATYPGKPLFFSQVRDAVAYLRMPEQLDTVTATYVSDMGAAVRWADPGATNWVAADKAVYVVGSDAKGGMDQPEFVPFTDPAKAQAFAVLHGGAVLPLAQIPDAALAVGAPDGDNDYAARLRSLSNTGG